MGDKTKETCPVGLLKTKDCVFLVFFPFVLTLLMLGLMSMSYAYVDAYVIRFSSFLSVLLSFLIILMLAS